MSDFRRDKNLQKITITEQSLTNIDSILEEVESRLLKENAQAYCYLSFVIRYDEKGFRFFTFNELLEHYHKAEKIEKIILRLDVNPTLPAGMSKNEVIDIFITSLAGQVSYFAVESSDAHWVNSTFTMLDDVFRKSHCRFSWVRGAWVPLVVQLFGVVSIFIISLLLSKYFSQFLLIENSLLITFIFIFLIFSNGWTHLNTMILNIVHNIFPNIYFKRKNKVGLNDDMQDKISNWLIASGVTVIGLILYFIKANLYGLFIK